jgi:hypothetical protein
MKSGPIRKALRTFQGSALVHYLGTQLKADAAFRELAPHLTDAERESLAWARTRFHTDPQGHPASQFNDACEVVWSRLDEADA